MSTSIDSGLYAVHLSISSTTATRQSMSNFMKDKELPAGIEAIWKTEVIPSTELRALSNLKNSVERELSQYSVKGFAFNVIPKAEAATISEMLSAKKEEYLELRDALANKVERLVQDCRKRLELKLEGYEFKEELLKRFDKFSPDHQYISQNVDFRYFVYKADAMKMLGSDDFGKEVNSLYPRLLAEIEKDADSMMDNLLCGDYVSGRTIKRVRKIAEKVKRLSFLNPALVKLHNGIKSVVDSLPLTGSVPVAQAGQLGLLMALMSDSDRLFERLEKDNELVFTQKLSGFTASDSMNTPPEDDSFVLLESTDGAKEDKESVNTFDASQIMLF